MARDMAEKPQRILDYFIKIGLTREEVLLLPSRRGSPSADAYLTFVGLTLDESALQVARRALGVTRERPEGNTIERKASLRGTIATYRRTPKTKPYLALYGLTEAEFKKVETTEFQNFPVDIPEHVAWPYLAIVGKPPNAQPTLGHYRNTFASLCRRFPEKQQRLLNIPASHVFNAVEQSTFLSIHSLIGAIAELLGSSKVSTVLKQFDQVRTYPIPNWGIRFGETQGQSSARLTEPVGDDDEEESDQGNEALLNSAVGDKEYGNLINEIEIWRADIAEKLNKRTPLSVNLLAKVWARFYYTLLRIDEDLHYSQLAAGFLLHRSIVAFLNAIVVEEELNRLASDGQDSEGETNMRLANPTSSDANFLHNLGQAEVIGFEHYPIFSMFFSCPLWALYLDPGDTKAIRPGTVLDKQLNRWIPKPTPSKDSSTETKSDPDSIKSSRATILIAKFVDTNGDSLLEFPNFYWPLNSVLVPKPERRATANRPVTVPASQNTEASISTKPKGRRQANMDRTKSSVDVD